MTKKTLSFILVTILVMATILAGCGSSKDNKDNNATPGPTQTAGSKDEKVTIRIMTRTAGTSPTVAAYQGLLKNFMDENPNITVVDESLNDEAAFNNKFKTGLATGNLPEIWMNYGGESFKEYAKNVALDLQPFLDADKKWSGDFLPLLGTWQYKDVPGTFGVPTEFYSVAVYYNKEMFKKAGVEAPKTIEEIPALAEKFKAINAVPMAMGEKENFRGGHLITNLALKKYGFQKTQDLMSGTAKWNDPDMVSLLQTMKDWQDAGVFGKNIVTMDGNTATTMFFEEKSAMLFEGVWALSQMAASPIADKIGVITFPGYKDKPELKDNWFGGAGGYSVSKAATGAKQEATIKLVKYLTSVEAFQKYLKETGGGVYPVKMDVDTTAVDPITIQYMEALDTASDFKGEISEYSPITQLLDKARNEIQGMFAGNSAQKTGDAIQNFVDSNSK
ncbi:ABC transporter substrate-binding protein [Paenibacillus eucommiae]|uniref:Raffinose/stachyose/melibiose transport system substrate-binding protein n=1 Tax=Paenibacillus eucommiae TaxID=1355755 RepID=A0ABS4J2P4_9BACL|nr:extracellular solute-binding protein [Paenibacillus eucommiae]MBP1994083.1 raffinose/stachyose/melibiose transport system substrate-binding protein [Paenibacillus eucommiae]